MEDKLEVVFENIFQQKMTNVCLTACWLGMGPKFREMLICRLVVAGAGAGAATWEKYNHNF